MWLNNPIDYFLNRITMYRLALYFLIVLVLAGFIYSFFGLMPFAPQSIVFSTAVLTIACLGFNWLLAKFFSAQTNAESSYITALILALIITPPAFTFDGLAFLLFAALFTMASKYVLTWRIQHLFNPAALGVLLTAFVFGWYASWWVGGNLPMLPMVLMGGLLVVRKLQRFDLVLTFIIAALASILLTSNSGAYLATIDKALLHTTIFFFAFIMLTEPSTTPPTRAMRMFYGALVGILFSPAIHFGGVYSTPELALIIGNLFSFAVSPKIKASLRLKEKKELGGGIWEFIFERPKNFAFASGQYMEWTLPNGAGLPAPAKRKWTRKSGGSDGRGNRRYFTIASAPSENDVRLGVRMQQDGGSAFKKKLLALKSGETIAAGQLAGEFTLPANPHKKIALIAGGIGITPMRSMLKYISDRREKRDVVLLYSNRTRAEIAYADIFSEAQDKIGAKVIYAITDEKDFTPLPNQHLGFIDADMIKREIPDWAERVFYISGTRAMTLAFEKILREMGIHRSHIKIDFFPGFA